jgi:FkbM family methyltransferase
MTNTLGELSTDHVRRLARELAWTRPLEPYPGWQFASDWDKPGLAFQLRRLIWTYCHDQGLQESFVMDWYDGLRVNLYLGNDLSLPLFVGGCIEPNEFAFLDRVLKPGMTFIDGGANDGLYTLFASRRVGPTGLVWAFEPSEREFERLRNNIQLNDLANVRASKLALLNRNGSAELTVAEYEHAGQNTLGDFVYGGVEQLRKLQVPTRRLDDLMAEEGLERLDAMKLDVEGAETAVLEGATHVLSNMRPLLLMEVTDAALRHQGSSQEDLLSMLRSYEYRLYVFDQATGMPVAENTAELSENIVAIPAEQELPSLHP